MPRNCLNAEFRYLCVVSASRGGGAVDDGADGDGERGKEERWRYVKGGSRIVREVAVLVGVGVGAVAVAVEVGILIDFNGCKRREENPVFPLSGVSFDRLLWRLEP